MGRRALLSVAAFVFAMAVAGSPPASAQSAEDGVRKAESDRFTAMLKRDTPALERLLAPDLVYTHGDGRVVDKATFIAESKTGDFVYQTIEPGEVKIRVFGNTAVVTGAAGMTVVNKGAPAQIKIRYTTVQVQRNGTWQMVAWQATRLPQ
jgi:ketosteroid isomerase-like protein